MDEVKKLFDMINKRIVRAEKRFKMNEETAKIWREQLTDILPNSDILTKSGLLSLSDKKIQNLTEEDIQVIRSNIPLSMKELKQNAIESLEESGIEDIDAEIINIEVSATIRVGETFSDAVDEWYDFIQTVDPMYLSDKELMELESELYSSGRKSYAELENWMNRASRVISRLGV